MWPHFAHGRSKVARERVIVAGGKEFTTRVVMHLVVEDGRIVRMHLYEDTLTVAEAFNAA